MSRYVPMVNDDMADCILRIHEQMAAAGASDDEIAETVWKFWLEAKRKILH
jgi:hypothetical protein